MNASDQIRGVSIVGSMTHDMRYALRALAKRPTYAVVTVLVFTLAIAANATVFTVLNGLLLRPLPYPDGDRLVMVFSSYPRVGAENGGTSLPDFLDRREQAPSLASLAMVAPAQRTLTGEGAPEQLSLARVSPSLFEVLSIAPLIGRGFVAAEETPGSDRVVVLSHRLWRTRFGAREDVIGRDVRLDGELHRVVGVMPAAFGFPNTDIDAWVPLAFTPAEAADNRRGNSFGISVGRLAPGATIDTLHAELETITQRNAARLPELAPMLEATGFTARAKPLREDQVGELEQMLLVLQGIVLAVLLMACANVANLQLSRTAARRKELAVRAMLGADGRRLARLVLAESLVLALVGGGAGLLLSVGGLELVRALGLDRARQGFEFALDAAVLGFTAAAALTAALLSGLVPVVALLRDDLVRGAQEAGRLGGGGRAAQRLRNALVVVQLAASVTLLAGAGLLTKRFWELEREGPGFAAENVLTAAVALPPARYSPESRARFIEQALEELAALPGVVRAGFTSMLPFSGTNTAGLIAVSGYVPPASAPPPSARFRTVSEEYFTSLDMRIVRGRNFAADEPERAVIVDEALAAMLWPGRDALGERVRNAAAPADQWYTVIGVVPTVKHLSLVEDSNLQTIYWHYRQQPPAAGVFTLKTALPPESIAAAARAAVLRIDPDLALFDVMPLDTRVLRSLGPQRTPMALTAAFAVVAFTLAVAGIYGVLTWAVTQRVGEIGVRLALGARGADIVRMVLAQGARLIVLGLVLGVAGAFVLGRVLSSQLYGADEADPTVYAAAGAALAAAALIASWLPARRAARTEPMQALRVE